ncbi:MAG: glycoside hydrolase family 3 C-terminal domain-containing protein [Bacteroidota bacterium]
MRSGFIALLTAILTGTASLAQSQPQLGKDPVSKVIANMTPKEKACLVTGTGMFYFGSSPVPGAAGTTHPIPRLGIPAQVLADGPAGLRISPKRPGNKDTFYCTAFPTAILLASTWDTGLIYRVGEAMGNEVLEYGADIILGPGLNIHRNPLCGRNFEYYSEDPFVAGKIAAAMVNGIESQGVGASIKHFAANNCETDRRALNTIVSERALREIYLEGFRIAVEEAQPWTVMSSYNLINGVYAPENHDLLTKILREDWGFKGYVMTDWYGGKDPVAMMKAGNDLLMPGTRMQANSILSAVRKGKLDVEILDRNIGRILTVIQQSPRFRKYICSNKPDLKLHAEIARQAAGEGMVLLKNENRALPLPAGSRVIATFGKASMEINTGGTGSGDVNEAYSISIVRGLEEAGYILNQEILRIYSDYLKKDPDKHLRSQHIIRRSRIQEMALDTSLIKKAADQADAALITIGRSTGEYTDRRVEDDFNLTRVEMDLIRTVCDAFRAAGKKSIVILNTGGVVETASWKEWPDAILMAWQAGQETGRSIADVLSGKVNPSGKLASSFPVRYEDVPSARNFPGKPIGGKTRKLKGGVVTDILPRKSEILYEEGIYVGYRYYNTFKVPVSYEFGYGLSYTRFTYGKPHLNATEFSGRILVSLEITNAGETAGREVVQLYLSAPAGKLDKPEAELKGFAKTKLLQPGESQTLTFDLSPRALASFDPEASAWIAEAGEYTVRIGASSKDIRQTANFTLNKNLTVKKENVALVTNVSLTH